jgi:hypothetical protein
MPPTWLGRYNFIWNMNLRPLVGFEIGLIPHEGLGLKARLPAEPQRGTLAPHRSHTLRRQSRTSRDALRDLSAAAAFLHTAPLAARARP